MQTIAADHRSESEPDSDSRKFAGLAKGVREINISTRYLYVLSLAKRAFFIPFRDLINFLIGFVTGAGRGRYQRWRRRMR